MSTRSAEPVKREACESVSGVPFALLPRLPLARRPSLPASSSLRRRAVDTDVSVRRNVREGLK